MAHAKHQEVRERYHAQCGYCSVSEDDAGGEFTVDHFVPASAGGNDDDDNLVYACFRCNLFKADFLPTDVDEKSGHVLLHPLRDNVQAHLRMNDISGRLEPLTETGRFQITLLHLNRPALVSYRMRKRFQELLAARQELLHAEISELRAIIRAQEKYIVHLKQLVQHGPDGEPG